MFIRRRRNDGMRPVIFKQEMGMGMGATSESALAARRRGKEPAPQSQGVVMAGAGAEASSVGGQEYLQPESARASSVGGRRPSLVLAGDMSGRASFPSIVVDGEGGDGRV